MQAFFFKKEKKIEGNVAVLKIVVIQVWWGQSLFSNFFCLVVFPQSYFLKKFLHLVLFLFTYFAASKLQSRANRDFY